MLAFPSSVRIYVSSGPTDLRRGFDGLSALTRSVIGADTMSGHLFVFINNRKNRIKILAWDRTGYLLLYKRLERGTFRIPVKPEGEALLPHADRDWRAAKVPAPPFGGDTDSGAVLLICAGMANYSGRVAEYCSRGRMRQREAVSVEPQAGSPPFLKVKRNTIWF